MIEPMGIPRDADVLLDSVISFLVPLLFTEADGVGLAITEVEDVEDAEDEGDAEVSEVAEVVG